MTVKKYYCNICGATKDFTTLWSHHDNNYYVDSKEFTLIECNTCHVATIKNKPTADQLKKYYERNYYAYDTSGSVFFRLKEKWVKWAGNIKSDYLANKLLFSFLYMRPNVSNGKVLDVGCGDGSALLALQWLGFKHLSGSEINPTICKKLRQKGIATYCTPDITTSKLEKQSFDLIRLSHVLEHVYNPRETIAFLREKLVEGGSLVIGVPNFNSLAARTFGRYFCGLQLPTHLYHFNSKNLKQLLNDEGYLVRQVRTTGFSGISYSLITVLKDRGQVKNVPSIISLPLVLIFLPFELILNFFGQGYIINIEAKKAA
jgi:2-polyprenyl-3-methyl-5-hydroxy-6-metoxy-1,4-benzoquinol methylase